VTEKICDILGDMAQNGFIDSDISDNSAFRYGWYGMGFQSRIRMKVGLSYV
jgi:hypothetical protein